MAHGPKWRAVWRLAPLWALAACGGRVADGDVAGDTPEDERYCAEGTPLCLEAVLAPQPGACDGPLADSAPPLDRGTLDLALAYEYAGHVRVLSERSSLQIRDMEIALLVSGELATEFTSGSSAALGAGTAQAPHVGVLESRLLPSPVGKELGTRLPGSSTPLHVTLLITARATTPEGEDVRSNTLSFELSVCEGCLIDFPAEALELSTDGALCAAGDGASVMAPCRLGQDERVDCRLCADSEPACQRAPMGEL